MFFLNHAITKNWIESTENRWNSSGKIVPGFTTLRIPAEIQNMIAELKCEPEQFQGRIIFISTYHDIIWWTPRHEDNCMANSTNVASYAKRFPHGCWSYLVIGCEKVYGTHANKPHGEWNRVAEIMMLNFAESGHPVFRATSALGRGELLSKGGEKKTIHCKWRNRWVDSSPGYIGKSAKNLQMGKNCSDNLHSIKNTGNNLTLKQMFDTSEKLIFGQSDEIFGVSHINWEDSSRNQLSLVSDEEVISLSHAKVYVFSDSVLCLGKMNQNPESNTVWEEK